MKTPSFYFLLVLLLLSGLSVGLQYQGGGYAHQGQATTISASVVEAYGKRLWTRTRERTATENALAHFEEHGAEFGFKTPDAYIRAAHEFLENPPPRTQTRIGRDGDILRFNPDIPAFGVMTRRGTPRTFFKPEPRIHGYDSNQSYFNAAE